MMDVVCANIPRCAFQVSCLSPASASTSKYSSVACGHRALHTRQTHSEGRRHQCFLQSPRKAQCVAVTRHTTSSLQQLQDSFQLCTTQPADKQASQAEGLSSIQRLARCTVHGFAAAALLTLMLPDPSYSAESLPIEFLRSWVDEVERLGPVKGPLLFIITVGAAEMIPLFPTQPLSLASGLLFGPVQGTVCIILGTSLAAISAFSIARGVGRRFAQRIIDQELSNESPNQAATVETKFQGVQNAIENGTFAQQTIAVAALRLTPVVPFSASNYLLGMTPLEIPAFMTGTVAGMTVWGCVYASIGGAGRNLLKSGVDLEEVVSDLTAEAAKHTEEAAAAALVLGLGVGCYYVLRMAKAQKLKQEEALTLQQEAEVSNRSAVGRVRQLVQRLKGHA